jgi:hypothetical protein
MTASVGSGAYVCCPSRIRRMVSRPCVSDSGDDFSGGRNFEREAVVDERALMRDALSRSMGTAPSPKSHLNSYVMSKPARSRTIAETLEGIISGV